MGLTVFSQSLIWTQLLLLWEGHVWHIWRELFASSDISSKRSTLILIHFIWCWKSLLFHSWVMLNGLNLLNT